MIRYETDKAIVEIHFADITDSERQKRKKKLEEGLIRYYKEVIRSGFKWPEDSEEIKND